ncbi:TlpA family protein disulfide reductase, partial [Eubacteriales bacterium OttesenSCG-928-M02]|nr:TlpA family protein disulfide reductase [Eubacteriales bacterium OttesenSCG-928-M02]
LAIALLVGMVGCKGKEPDKGLADLTEEEQGIVQLLGNSPFPEMTLLDEKKNEVVLKAEKDEILVVNFWATWCPYCIEEIPILNQVAAENKGKKVRVVMVNTLDTEGSAYSAADIQVIQSNKAPLNIQVETYVDHNLEAAQALNLRSLPQTLIVDGENILRFTYPGMLEDAGQLEEMIGYVRDYSKYKPVE